jgi:3-oxoacyl-[acyl-carrier-protein] synthase II
MNKIAIVGAGIVSPLGIGRETFFAAAREDRVGICDLTLCEPFGECEHAGEIGNYDWKEYVFSKQTYADRCTQLAIGAARLALEDGGVALPIVAGETGFCFGTCWGCLESMRKFYEPVAQGKGKSASGLVFSHSYPNCPTSFCAIELGLRGYSTSFTGSRLAGLWALRSAYDALASGTATDILVCAADALGTEILSHLEAEKLASATRGKTPPETSDVETSDWGKVPGEAAVGLLLSTAPGKKPLGYLLSVTEEVGGGELDWRGGNSFSAQALQTMLRKLARGKSGGEFAVSDTDSRQAVCVKIRCA